AYWNLDEGTIGTEADATGLGHTGTANGEVASSVGYFNNAISFHGTGNAISNVSVPNTADMQFSATQSFTISAWVFPSSLNGIYEAVFAKSFNTGNYYGIWISPASKWVFRGPGGDVVGSTATVSTWAHVAVVQDGAANTRKIYVNGALAGSGTAQAANGSGPLWIAQANPGDGTGTQSFPGVIDEVKLFNRALSATEITTLVGPTVLQATSTQTQGAAGTFTKVIFPTSAKALESRQGSTAGSYSLTLNFGSPVSTGITATLGLQGGGAASGSVGTLAYSNGNKTLTIPLTGVANVQGLNLHLANVQPSGGGTAGTSDVEFNVLRGDVNSDNVVNNLDVTQTQNAQGSAVSATTYRYDINCDGVINATDTSLVTSFVGTNLGAQLDYNASLGQTAIASTTQGTDVANNAIDGSFTTRWTAASGTFPQTWRVDLGTNHVLSRVDIAWYSSASRSYKYKIETSDDDSIYNQVVDKTANTTLGDTSDAFSGSGRYVRVTVTGSSAGFASMYEVAVIGHPSSGGGPTPVINSSLSASGTVGTPFSYQITATNSPTSYSATGLSGTGLTLNSSTGVISGTPSTTTGSPFSIGLSATNGNGTGPTATLTLTISAAGSPPVINSPLTATGTVGTPFSYQITATNSPTSFAATGLTGTGLTVNTTTGLISGTPSTTTGSPFTIGLSATNGSGTGPTANLSLTINASSGDTNLALSQPATASSNEAGNVVANGNDASTTSRWAAANGTYPQWWRVDLGSSKVLSRVDIMWFNPTTRAYKYKIETSPDDVNYTMVFDNTGNTTFGNTSNAITATAQYVRVTVTGSSNGGFASFFDIKVFGH
ncbi:MAG: discoidin domain-containing protein, partial [Chthoniobacterales bacterium]